MDVAARLGAVRREVRTGEREGVPVSVIVATRTYDTDTWDLWDSVTSADRIPRWFLPITGELRIGGRYQLAGNAGGTVLECEPPHRLSVTWEFGGEVSWVVIRLGPSENGRALLELEHTAPVSPDRWREYGPGAVGVGWDLMLLGLAEHASGAPAVRPEDALAWTASAEGLAYLGGSNDAWADANIAAGADVDAARSAAGRTLAFYTGAPATPGS